jgi:tetratricopeptide (TPR) repeat protein
LELDQQNAPAYLSYRGIAYLQSGQFKQSIADFEEAIAIDPQFADAYYFKGLALTNLDRDKEAIAAFREYIRLGDDAALIDQAKRFIIQLNPSNSN